MTRLSAPSGQVCRFVCAYVAGTASAGATLNCSIYDEDGGQGPYIATVGAGATRELSLPTTGTAVPTSSGLINNTDLVIPPGAFLRFASSAALQNETQTVYVCFLMSGSTEPTWDTTGSAGTPSLAASTISVANTLQLVAMP